MYSLKAIQLIPKPVAEVWKFFSDPENLQVITPPSLNLRIISAQHNDQIAEGQTIEYRVSPLFGISLYWMTEITRVEKEQLFIDEQRRGPYRLWRHHHYFRAIDGGTEMKDVVQYALPFGLLGGVARGIVKKELHNIFTYRYNKVEELMGKWEGNKMEILFERT